MTHRAPSALRQAGRGLFFAVFSRIFHMLPFLVAIFRNSCYNSQHIHLFFRSTFPKNDIISSISREVLP